MQVYLTPWSLRRSIAQRGLLLPDLPGFVTAEGYQGLELTDREIDGRAGALDVLRWQCQLYNCGLIVDINCDLTLADPGAGAEESEHVVRWLRRAAQLEVDRVRITLGGQSLSIQKLLAGSRKKSAAPVVGGGVLKSVSSSYPLRVFSHRMRTLLPVSGRGIEAKLEHAVGALQSIVPTAASLGIRMGVENHWGASSRPEWILKVVKAVDSPFLGTCPDFGNFSRSVEPYTALESLLPFATHVQAKSWRFDAGGEETRIDYGRCMALVRRSGYRGPITIEYEGPGGSLQDCDRSRDLILRYGT